MDFDFKNLNFKICPPLDMKWHSRRDFFCYTTNSVDNFILKCTRHFYFITRPIWFSFKIYQIYPLAAFCSRWLTGLRHWKHLCTLGLFFGLLFFCHEERFAQQNWHPYIHSECLYEGLTGIFRQRYLSSGATPLCIDQLKAGFWEVCCYHFSACSLALYDNFTVLVW